MKSIKLNFAYNILYQILVILLPLITAPYISRVLGATGVGIYAYTYSVVYYFQLIAMLGIGNHGNRSIAAVRDSKEEVSRVFCEIYSIQITTFTLAIIVYLVYVICIKTDYTQIALIQLLYLISGLLDISWFFFGLEEFKLTVMRNAAIKLVSTISIFLFVKGSSDLWKYVLILAGGTMFSQVYLWFYLPKYIERIPVNIVGLKRHFRPVLVLFVPVIAYSIYKVMDKIMLGDMCSYAQVGYYQNAEKIINLPMGIITALGTVMLPRMSNLISNGQNEKANEYINLSFKVVTIIGAPIAFGLIAVSDMFTPIFYGEGFEPCSSLIRLLSVTVFFMAWANVIRTQYLIPKHRDKVYVLSTAIGAVVNLLINFLLIPRYYANGAAIGTIMAEFSVMLVQIILIKKEIPVFGYIVRQSGYLLIAAVMCIVVWITSARMDASVISLMKMVVLGGVIYGVGVILYAILMKDEVYTMIISRINKK